MKRGVKVNANRKIKNFHVSNSKPKYIIIIIATIIILMFQVNKHNLNCMFPLGLRSFEIRSRSFQESTHFDRLNAQASTNNSKRKPRKWVQHTDFIFDWTMNHLFNVRFAVHVQKFKWIPKLFRIKVETNNNLFGVLPLISSPPTNTVSSTDKTEMENSK